MTKGLKLSHRNRRDVLQSYLMLLPAVIGLFLFVLYPIGWTFRYCLFRYDGYYTMKFIGLQNFQRAFTDSRFWESVLNTFIFAVGKLAVELPLALLLAVMLNRAFRGRNFFRTIFYLPTIISVAIIGVVFYFLFAAHNGVINGYLQALGLLPTGDHAWFQNKWSSIFVMCVASIWQNFGLNMIFFLSGLQSIPEDIYESAIVDGATGTQQFWRITFPMLGPVLVIVVMNAFLGSLKVTDLVLVLSGGSPSGHSESMMSYIYKQYFTISSASNYGYGAALSVIAAVILGVLTVIYLRSTKSLQDIY